MVKIMSMKYIFNRLFLSKLLYYMIKLINKKTNRAEGGDLKKLIRKVKKAEKAFSEAQVRSTLHLLLQQISADLEVRL
jgi:hypothetical protein